MKKTIALLILLLCGELLDAQFLPFIPQDVNQNPPSTRFYKLKTPAFNIIYPSSLEKEAIRLAKIMEMNRHAVFNTMSVTSRLDVLMHNRMAESNAFATLFPRRIELFPMAPQNTFAGSNDWYTLTAIHEYRHISQFSLYSQNGYSFFYTLFGPLSIEILTTYSTPLWFFEGDAVCAETALTKSGRGRQPGFIAEQRAFQLSGKKYTYENILFGSYKKWYPPDHPYSYGYLITSDLRYRYGHYAVRNIGMRTAENLLIPWRFARSFKKLTGLTIRKYHTAMMDSFGVEWHKQNATPPSIADTLIRANKKSFTYILFPNRTIKGTIVSLQYGFDKIPCIVLNYPENGSEEILYRSYQINTDQPLSVYKNRVMFTETIPDERWGMVSYSEICILDMDSREIIRYRSSDRYLSPAFSPDGNYIAVVGQGTDNMCNLLVLNATNGTLIRRYNNPDEDYLQTPSWSPDQKRIVFTHIKKTGGKQLSVLEVETGEVSAITGYNDNEMSFPVFIGNWIAYQGSLCGSENIYAVRQYDTAIYRITDEPFAARYPTIDQWSNRLLYSTLTPDGYALLSLPIDTSDFKKVTPKDIALPDKRLKELINQEKSFNPHEPLDSSLFSIRKYNGLFTGNSIYQWGIRDLDSAYNLSVGVQARNLTNKVAMGVNYIYNLIEQTSTFSAEMSYSRFYPILDAGLNVGDRSNYTLLKDSHGIDSADFYSWYQESAYFRLRVPFNFSRKNYLSELMLGTSLNLTENNLQVTNIPLFNGSLRTLNHSLQYSRYTIWIKDLKPKWGQFIKINYQYTPFTTSSVLKGDFFSANGVFYMPGMVRYHSFYTEGGYEYYSNAYHPYRPLLRFSRGYQPYTANQVSLLSVNYMFPVLCPDLNLFTFLYSKRISAKLFYDFSRIHYSKYMNLSLDKTFYFRSAGVELASETFFMRWPIPFMLTGRWSYLFDKQERVIFELLMMIERF